MVIDVFSILKEIGGKIVVSGDIGIEDTEFLGESFHFDTLRIDGDITNNGKSLILSAVVCGDMRVNCARCRKPIVESISFEVNETFIQGYDGDNEDVCVFNGHLIDLDDVVYNNFLMNVSGKYLCSEDCKGLCPKCGADLNAGECGCSDDDIDPRWEALLSMMDNTDEK